MRAWVTGSGGFVGRRLLPRLESEGWEVTGSDLELDVTDRDAIERQLAALRPQAVVHLAAQSSVALSLRDPVGTHRINYLGTLNILRGALALGRPPRVLLVGSADQYGRAEPGAPPFDELAPPRPASPYARSKAEADALGAAFATAGLPVVRVRAFSHTGAGQSDTFVLSSFARQLAEIGAGSRERVIRVGNLDSVRDYLDVDDVIEAYVRLLDDRVPVDAYNVASGQGHRIGELLDRMIGLSGTAPRIERDPARFRPTDFSVGDASRLRAATGWEPRVAIDRTLQTLLDDWRARISAS